MEKFKRETRVYTEKSTNSEMFLLDEICRRSRYRHKQND